MSARFRVRTRDGAELEVRDIDELAVRIEAGEVTAQDLMFDAETREWAPAGVHDAFRAASAPVPEQPPSVPEPVMAPEPPVDSRPAKSAEPVLEVESSPPAAEPPAAPPAGATDDDLGFSLELMETIPGLSDEERRSAFLESMERERADDASHGLSQSLGLPVVHGGSELGVGREGPPPPPPPAPPVQGGPSRPVASDGPISPPTASRPIRPHPRPTESVLQAPAPTARPAAPAPPRRHRGPSPVAGIVKGVVIIAVVGVGSWALAMRFGRNPVPPPVVEEEPPVIPLELPASATVPAVDPGIEARRILLQGWSEDWDRLGVGEIPEEWLDGRYFSAPEGFPEVLVFWQGYRDWVMAGRDEESERYRQAYREGLARAGVAGSAGTSRLTDAMAQFDADQPLRAQVYDMGIELAQAALDLHAILLDMEGDITYEPARGERLSEDPVVEAAAVTDSARIRFETALDRVLGLLDGIDGEPGPGQAERLRDWLSGFLERAITPDDAG
ncbi:MAG: hypothetical protein OEZ65_05295 [Gemmatimonadota bacterium]|nr:hypothetical protein [Gemmatimonadota bacterium]